MPIENDGDLVKAVHQNPAVQDAVVAHLDGKAVPALTGGDQVLLAQAIDAAGKNPNLAPAMRPFEPTVPLTLEERIARLEARVFPVGKAATK